MNVEYRSLHHADLREFAELFAEVFDDDAPSRFVLPDPVRRAKTLGRSYAAAARDTLAHGHAQVAVAGGHIVGGALWLPPGAYPLGAVRNLRAAFAFRGAFRTPSLLRASREIVEAVDRVHPRAPHWYLLALGMKADARRRGIGSRLIETGLDAADRARLGCHLETAREENLVWYRRKGFELTNTLDPIAGGPRYWTMWRPPMLSRR